LAFGSEVIKIQIVLEFAFFDFHTFIGITKNVRPFLKNSRCIAKTAKLWSHRVRKVSFSKNNLTSKKDRMGILFLDFFRDFDRC